MALGIITVIFIMFLGVLKIVIIDSIRDTLGNSNYDYYKITINQKYIVHNKIKQGFRLDNLADFLRYSHCSIPLEYYDEQSDYDIILMSDNINFSSLIDAILSGIDKNIEKIPKYVNIYDNDSTSHYSMTFCGHSYDVQIITGYFYIKVPKNTDTKIIYMIHECLMDKRIGLRSCSVSKKPRFLPSRFWMINKNPNKNLLLDSKKVMRME